MKEESDCPFCVLVAGADNTSVESKQSDIFYRSKCEINMPAASKSTFNNSRWELRAVNGRGVSKSETECARFKSDVTLPIKR
jgi:hypothetical protein